MPMKIRYALICAVILMILLMFFYGCAVCLRGTVVKLQVRASVGQFSQDSLGAGL